MGKVGAAILGAVTGSFFAVGFFIVLFGWGVSGNGQPTHIDPTRADYVDLLLTIVTVFLGAVGLVVTLGALVIGIVALKTLREIKEEAASNAKDAAANKINETMAAELEPSVHEKVQSALPEMLPEALLNNELGHKILTGMAQRGDLDVVLERVVMRVQNGGPELDSDA
ncbi:hypothetical protein [Polycladidibacter stylochi]|uniref:hypothetical protein n=1 Tax=Polycladidibacter stylochi TaxID=1807766 RepID=UPI0008357646|nr:hypothetical protein [Pseudovibrio stylochi]